MCTTTAPTASGSFNTGKCGKACVGYLHSISASGTTLVITDTLFGSSTITLAGGVTASGSFVPAETFTPIRMVMVSGSTMTFMDSTGASGSITFSGATLSGGPTPMTYFYSVIGSGASLIFGDVIGATTPFTMTGVETCS